MKILMLLGSKSDLSITSAGFTILKEMGVSFSMRIGSAHRTPNHVHKIVAEFETNGGQVIIGVAGKAAHLPGVVASLTALPVIGVPVFSSATAGLDALLAISQMPAGIPVATMSFGEGGFTNACLMATAILGLSDPTIRAKLARYRAEQTRKVEEDDRTLRVDFTGTP